MYEVELKAHVADRTKLITTLNSFADFCGAIHKEDVYWKQQKHRYFIRRNKKKLPVKVRIRRETITNYTNNTNNAQTITERILLTYKIKEMRTGANGTSFEVNDEKECVLSAADPIESLLTDSGFAPALHKQKEVLDWKFDGALFELCTVPPLGDFLEIEIMSPSDDDKIIKSIKTKLEHLLKKSGIDQSAIEPRYYSEMLKAFKKS